MEGTAEVDGELTVALAPTRHREARRRHSQQQVHPHHRQRLRQMDIRLQAVHRRRCLQASPEAKSSRVMRIYTFLNPKSFLQCAPRAQRAPSVRAKNRARPVHPVRAARNLHLNVRRCPTTVRTTPSTCQGLYSLTSASSVCRNNSTKDQLVELFSVTPFDALRVDLHSVALLVLRYNLDNAFRLLPIQRLCAPLLFRFPKLEQLRLTRGAPCAEMLISLAHFAVCEP